MVSVVLKQYDKNQSGDEKVYEITLTFKLTKKNNQHSFPVVTTFISIEP